MTMKARSKPAGVSVLISESERYYLAERSAKVAA